MMNYLHNLDRGLRRKGLALRKAVATLSMLFVLGTLSLSAQEKITVSGKVIDANENVLIGVSVSVKGTSIGTSTNVDGNYTLANVPANAVLDFNYIGYTPQSVAVNSRKIVNATMLEEVQAMDEVVVVGYGTARKSDVTGAITRVGAKDIEARPVSNAMQALQGKAAGVDITSNERPGELGTVRVRGVRSITATSDPLYVVDGIPLMSSSAIETLNPRDIESVDVLKDASATAIYGSRGANGVIIVTTKKGKQGSFSLNYSGTFTFEDIDTYSPMMSASEYITWRRWAAYNAGLVSNPGDQPSKAADQTVFSRTYGGDATAWANIMKGWSGDSWDGSKVTNTDWTDYITQTAFTQEHSISASGGTEKLQAYASFGYLNNAGTMKGQTYERYTSKVSVDITPTPWFRMGGNIVASWSEQDYGFSRLAAPSNSGPDNIYGAATRIFNYALPFDANGDLITYPGGDDAVPTVMNEWLYSTQQRQMFRALGSFYAQLDLGEIIPSLKGLKYRFNFGPDYRNWREGSYVDSKSVNRVGGPSYARLNNQRDFSWTLDNMITYNNVFCDKHSVGLTLLQTASAWDIETSGMSGYGIPQPMYLWNAFGTLDLSDTATKASMSSGISNRQLESYMARLNYGFNDRYLLTASGRWDGASQLAAGNKWAFFPSASIAWRMDQEEFIKRVSWIDHLKLRLGYGSTGNSAVGPYKTLGAIQSLLLPFDTNLRGYTTNEPNYTNSQVEMSNKHLGWEVTSQFNLGIDFSILRGRISGAVDVYTSKTKDLLLSMSIPTLTGYPRITANIGETSNKGIDITLNTINVKTRDFEWNTNTSLAYTKDKIEVLSNGKTDDIANSWFIGESISVFYAIAADGLWQESDRELMDKYNANGHNFKVGMVKPVDYYEPEKYKIDANDRQVLGNQNPRWTFGMVNTMNYKGVELSFMMYGRFKYMVNTGGEGQLGRNNQRSISYWTPSNTNADYQMPIYNEAGGDAYSSLLGYMDGNFLKMRNISLGYIFPRKVAKAIGANNLKVYAQATNPFTIYSSVDFRDLDLGGATYNRGFLVGIDLTF